MKAYPVSNLGWFEYYRRRFEKTGNEQAAHLALLYFLNDLMEHDNG